MPNPTSVEHPPGFRHPLDSPYPFDNVSPSRSETSSLSSTLSFLLSATEHQSPESLRSHAIDLQAKAYEIFPYPCIRSFAFLRAKAGNHPECKRILAISKDDPDAIYLDLGGFFGTDARKVVYDGWDPTRVLASDLRPEWFDLGFSFFGDQETCPITFLAGDIFSPSFLPTPSSPPLPPSPPATSLALPLSSLSSLAPLVGHIRAISAFSFFHLFEEDGQRELASKLASLLSPKKGSTIFGGHVGGSKMGLVPRGNGPEGEMRFVHSPESWKDLWEVEVFPGSREAGDTGETRVKVKAELLGKEAGEGGMTGMLVWSVVVI